MSFDRSILSFTHHYSIMWNSLTALKISCASLIHLYPTPQTTGYHWSLYCLEFLTFLWFLSQICNHGVCSLSSWLISLSNINLFPSCLLWLDSSFLFTAEYYMDCPFTYWRTSRLLQVWKVTYKAVKTFVYRLLCGHNLQPFVKYLGVHLLDSVLRLYLTF